MWPPTPEFWRAPGRPAPLRQSGGHGPVAHRTAADAPHAAHRRFFNKFVLEQWYFHGRVCYTVSGKVFYAAVGCDAAHRAEDAGAVRDGHRLAGCSRTRSSSSSVWPSCRTWWTPWRSSRCWRRRISSKSPRRGQACALKSPAWNPSHSRSPSRRKRRLEGGRQGAPVRRGTR